MRWPELSGDAGPDECPELTAKAPGLPVRPNIGGQTAAGFMCLREVQASASPGASNTAV